MKNKCAKNACKEKRAAEESLEACDSVCRRKPDIGSVLDKTQLLIWLVGVLMMTS